MNRTEKCQNAFHRCCPGQLFLVTFIFRFVCVCVCFVFQDRVSLRIFDCPGTHSVDQADLELTEICLLLLHNPLLGLKVCDTTTPAMNVLI